tara:strand:+ start:114 stop:323 length:210 start_codon:yes stop_codon:yes gene_type:complete
MGLEFDGLPPEVQRALREQEGGTLRVQRKERMTQDAVRGYAIRALAPLASLSQSDRNRVLRQALKANEA